MEPTQERESPLTMPFSINDESETVDSSSHKNELCAQTCKRKCTVRKYGIICIVSIFRLLLGVITYFGTAYPVYHAVEVVDRACGVSILF